MGEPNTGTAPADSKVIDAELVPYDQTKIQKSESRPSLFDLEPEDQIIKATQIANALCKVIEKQKLFTTIQGKKHVRVDGWELLGTFLGVLPKEVGVTEHPDGSFEARVELVRASNGVTVGGASALCGTDEKRWATADRYARRSMATTRAIGKAYRSSFSWIINLAGYEVTPAEEIPREENTPPKSKATRPGPNLYQGTTEQQKTFKVWLAKHKIGEEHWQSIHDVMMGKPPYKLEEELLKLGLKKEKEKYDGKGSATTGESGGDLEVDTAGTQADGDRPTA